MHESLKAILMLQQIDTEMIFLREAKHKRPQELESERHRLQEKKKVVEGIVQEMKRLRMDSDRREVDLKKNEGEVVKIQIALNQAKTNQEYQIHKDQIARLKGDNSKIEEEVLKKLGEIDGLAQAKKDGEAELKAFEVEFNSREEELKKILQGLEGQLAALSQRRAAAIRDIPADYLQLYERVLARLKDTALVRVENKVCQGCFMSVNPQKVNTIMIGRELVQCGNCLRILYLD